MFLRVKETIKLKFSLESTESTQKPVVFLQHGLLCTSSVWVMNLPEQSAGFLFADNGYDVWLGNNRGNSYSRGHITKNITAAEYWNFR